MGVAALLALTGAGVATAATGNAAQPPVTHAEGIYVAMNGTSEAGDWAPQSDAIVDPELGTCYDLTSFATGPAEWTESVNRTDAVALLSRKGCAELTEGEPDSAGHAPRWTSPHSVSDSFVFRSVRFAHLP
ncbi:hypothetical protein GCM10023175_63290 [Pseudonocardia xishanensis]|uniref:Peptidase inhibitor family I36 n=1 Tax=Pseudonocardia xishanensis TaxID=630995 RepID=A0ABP8S334_9PSEU